MFKFTRPINEKLYILNIYALELRNDVEHKNNLLLQEVNKFFYKKEIDYNIEKEKIKLINLALKNNEFKIEDFYKLLVECKEQSFILSMIINKNNLTKIINTKLRELQWVKFKTSFLKKY